MCGILAAIGASPLVRSRCSAALDLLRHRGPDDRGEWSDASCWLGHRRLAIIDLSPTGHQPMVHPKTGDVVTFNGEIYNYVELRDELQRLGHRFRGCSDTEVLLAAYVQWGRGCLSKLNGMWSFVIWNPVRRQAFFARDRLGVKPLYYSVRDGVLAVASEPKSVAALWPQRADVDEVAMYDFLATGRLHASERSFYDGIASLPPGHSGSFKPEGATAHIERYWALPVGEESELCESDALERFTELFEDATRLRMRSDVPVGVTLSGGLDSTAVLHAAAKAIPSIRAFTSVYAADGSPVVDEREWARLAARKHEQVRLEEIQAHRSKWLPTLERIVWHMDGPGYSPAVFPLWGIMEHARRAGVPVLLEGQGADELLGGYPQYAAAAFRSLLASAWRSPSKVWGEFRGYSDTFTIRVLALWLLRESLPRLTPLYRRRVGALGALRPEFAGRYANRLKNPPTRRTVNRWLADDLTQDILPGLLQYGDAISMAHAVESRLPFLDVRLVEFVARLPLRYKVAGGESKRILRHYLKRSGLDEVARRKDKQGYPTPAYGWMAENQAEVLRDVLESPTARIRQYCSRAGIRRLINHLVSGRRGSENHLYRLLTSEIWLHNLSARSGEVQYRHNALSG